MNVFGSHTKEYLSLYFKNWNIHRVTKIPSRQASDVVITKITREVDNIRGKLSSAWSGKGLMSVNIEIVLLTARCNAQPSANC